MPALDPRRRRVPVMLLSGLVAACGAAALASAALRLPPDIAYRAATDSPGPVVFSHATHVELADGKCTGCHPAPFRMLKPARHMTHREMNAGRLCGQCHDGKTAASVQEDCDHCHKPAVRGAP